MPHAKRFTRYTPSTQDSSSRLIIDPVYGPNGGAHISSHTFQDVNKFEVALCAIGTRESFVFLGSVRVAGHRAAIGAGIAQYGGKREKKVSTVVDGWVHPDAVGPRAQFPTLWAHSGS